MVYQILLAKTNCSHLQSSQLGSIFPDPLSFRPEQMTIRACLSTQQKFSRLSTPADLNLLHQLKRSLSGDQMGKERQTPNERPKDDEKARGEKSGLKDESKVQGHKPDQLLARDETVEETEAEVSEEEEEED